MKEAKENARRWLREAKNTLEQARRALISNDFNLACFLAEQTSQKSLKAVLYWDGARFVVIHSIAELLKTIGKTRSTFLESVDSGAKLDQYYLSSRYPDAVPEPAIPSELFTRDQATEAITIAGKIITLSAAVIS